MAGGSSWTPPIKIILFGSDARGEARDDSDLDLLVIERGLANTRAEMGRLRNLVRPLPIPEIIVVSREEFRDRAHLNGTVLHWAASEERVVHEATARSGTTVPRSRRRRYQKNKQSLPAGRCGEETCAEYLLDEPWDKDIDVA